MITLLYSYFNYYKSFYFNQFEDCFNYYLNSYFDLDCCNYYFNDIKMRKINK